MAKITFLKTQQSIELPSGTEFRDLFRYLKDHPLRFGCLQGDCRVCAIKIVEGETNVSKPTRQELKHCLPKGCRLACQCAILHDVVVEN